MRKWTWAALAATMMILAGPAAHAGIKDDVKTGVDAWEKGDFEAAVNIWRPLALAGDPDAQFNLGQAYRFGRGVTADLKLAEDWYRKAAAQQHRQAEDNLGLIMFQNGDRAGALPFIKISADRGDARAQYVLGTTLFNGDLLPRDWPMAYALMVRASSTGLARASAHLAQMDRIIPLEDRQRGLVIARDLEAQSARPPLPAAMPQPAPIPVPVVAPVPVPAPAAAASSDAASPPKAVATPMSAFARGKATPGWRVQLGAFGQAANAHTQWRSAKATIPSLAELRPFLVPSGGLTRLQAGPLADKAAAERACAAVRAAGMGCLVIAP
ncbi:MAG: hypothetical protein RIR59_620 [Pseudomonadota bacterium]